VHRSSASRSRTVKRSLPLPVPFRTSAHRVFCCVFHFLQCLSRCPSSSLLAISFGLQRCEPWTMKRPRVPARRRVLLACFGIPFTCFFESPQSASPLTPVTFLARRTIDQASLSRHHRKLNPSRFTPRPAARLPHVSFTPSVQDEGRRMGDYHTSPTHTPPYWTTPAIALPVIIRSQFRPSPRDSKIICDCTCTTRRQPNPRPHGLSITTALRPRIATTSRTTAVGPFLRAKTTVS